MTLCHTAGLDRGVFVTLSASICAEFQSLQVFALCFARLDVEGDGKGLLPITLRLGTGQLNVALFSDVLYVNTNLM